MADSGGDNSHTTKLLEQGKEFYDWATSHKHIKCFSEPVPDGILPFGCSATLNDFSVLVKFGPDDAVYDRHEDLRRRLARGNTILCVKYKQVVKYILVLFALKKFTGGSGDDDDRTNGGDKDVWQKYFTRPAADAKKIVATKKANGEALHISVVRIMGCDYFVGGSKNTHMLFRDSSDIPKYKHSRYRVAGEFCLSFLHFVDAIPVDCKNGLTRHLRANHLTAVFEILCPNHQHVENLSHLKVNTPVFIAWTSNDTDNTAFTSTSPEIGLEKAKEFELITVDYLVFSSNELNQQLIEILHGYGYEGYVLYFVDSDEKVFGLLKKKTAWYIIIRALREKMKHVISCCRRNYKDVSKEAEMKKIKKRMREIQNWLELSDEIVEQWIDIGNRCLLFCMEMYQQVPQFDQQVYNNFPKVWEQFLKSSRDLDDHVFT